MYQYAQLVHWMKRQDAVLIPASVDIDLTNICNQDCYYCDSAEFRAAHPESQTIDSYLALIDRLAEWNSYSDKTVGSLNTVCFSGGGEPTLYKGYEHVIAHSVNKGFRTSLTTNGTNLDRLVDNIDHTTIKSMAWIGVDMDAGNEALYETIRKTKNKSVFTKVVDNMIQLVELGANVDIKILLNEQNSTEAELRSIFELACYTGARMVYFRPTVLNNIAIDCRSAINLINQLSAEYSVNAKVNLKKFEPRTYSRCHQMYQFLIFSSDGQMYSCCENKGNTNFSIGAWNTGDFRDLWLSQQHHAMYNKINTKLCQPCRSHNHNLGIEQVMQNPDLQDTLFY